MKKGEFVWVASFWGKEIVIILDIYVYIYINISIFNILFAIYMYILYKCIYVYRQILMCFQPQEGLGRFGQIFQLHFFLVCAVGPFGMAASWLERVLMRSQGVYAACVKHVSLKPVGFSHISVDMTWKFLEL